jgi:glycerol kinase
MKDCFLVLDCGSSGVRAAAFSENGKSVASVHRKMRADFHAGGRAEYDGTVLLNAQLSVYKELLARVKEKGFRPVSLGVAAQRSTVAFWDRNTGEILAPVLSWQDGRAEEQLKKLRLSHEKVHAVTGLYKTHFYSAAKILWALENIPAVAGALKKGCLAAGPLTSLLIWNLTKEKTFYVDPTQAQRTMLFDIRKLQWDDDISAAFGIPRRILPELRPSVSDYGTCALAGVPVRAAIGDQQAAAFGLNVFEKGRAAFNFGTGAFFLAHTGSEPVAIKGLLTSVACHDQNGVSYLSEASVNSAGSALDWLQSAGLEFATSACDELCAQSKAPVLFLPALGGLGSPYWDYSVSPVITGLTPKTVKADFVRGAVEGIAPLVADNVNLMRRNGVEISSSRASGGLAASSYLLQYQSDILNLKIERAPVSEVTAFGCACLLARDSGVKTDSWFSGCDGSFSPSVSSGERKKRLARWRVFSDGAMALGRKLSQLS